MVNNSEKKTEAKEKKVGEIIAEVNELRSQLANAQEQNAEVHHKEYLDALSQNQPSDQNGETSDHTLSGHDREKESTSQEDELRGKIDQLTAANNDLQLEQANHQADTQIQINKALADERFELRPTRQDSVGKLPSKIVPRDCYHNMMDNGQASQGFGISHLIFHMPSRLYAFEVYKDDVKVSVNCLFQAERERRSCVCTETSSSTTPLRGYSAQSVAKVEVHKCRVWGCCFATKADFHRHRREKHTKSSYFRFDFRPFRDQERLQTIKDLGSIIW